MSITKSYNKHTDTYYAYETSYVWDDKLQKKVQKKVCVGHFDPQTGDIIPNAKRGRPGIKKTNREIPSCESAPGYNTDSLRLAVEGLASETQRIKTSLDEIMSACQLLEEQISALKTLLPEN